MRKLITFLATFLITFSSLAQGIGMNYKAVIKDGNGDLVSGQIIGVQFDVLKSNDTSIYTESHTITTDVNGIIVLIIGNGTASLGNFFDIDWSSDLYKLQVAIDLDQDGTPEISETSGFNSVPYAYTSIDNTWARSGDNTYTTSEKVGIGITAPTDLLHIEDPNSASIKLETPDVDDNSSIKLENGDLAGLHTFYKIENIDDKLSIAVDSDLNSTETGYHEKLYISNGGSINTDGSINTGGSINAGTNISAQNGTSINEFSIDGTLAGNSNNAVPTEAAVKTYVDNAISNGVSKSITIPASAFQGSNMDIGFFRSLGPFAYYLSGSGANYFLTAPVVLPVGSVITRVEFVYKDEIGTENLDFALAKSCGNSINSSGVASHLSGAGGPSSDIVNIGQDISETVGIGCQYFVEVKAVNNWSGGDMYVVKVNITYTE